MPDVGGCFDRFYCELYGVLKNTLPHNKNGHYIMDELRLIDTSDDLSTLNAEEIALDYFLPLVESMR